MKKLTLEVSTFDDGSVLVKSNGLNDSGIETKIIFEKDQFVEIIKNAMDSLVTVKNI